MTRRAFTVRIGSLALEASAEIAGEFRPAVTQADPDQCYPAESPEVEVCELRRGETDLTGLLEDEDILDQVVDQILNTLADEQFNGDEP